MDDFRKVQILFSRVLKIDEQEITLKTSIDNTESWDSLNTMRLISELEDIFSVEFTIDEIMKIRSVSMVMGILKNKRANHDAA